VEQLRAGGARRGGADAHEELSQLLTGQPFDGRVLDAVWLQVEPVRELLDHCGGLHEPDVLVRAMES
jgi:hypothetical protein